jgi:hypothetical protein
MPPQLRIPQDSLTSYKIQSLRSSEEFESTNLAGVRGYSWQNRIILDSND